MLNLFYTVWMVYEFNFVVGNGFLFHYIAPKNLQLHNNYVLCQVNSWLPYRTRRITLLYAAADNAAELIVELYCLTSIVYRRLTYVAFLIFLWSKSKAISPNVKKPYHYRKVFSKAALHLNTYIITIGHDAVTGVWP